MQIPQNNTNNMQNNDIGYMNGMQGKDNVWETINKKKLYFFSLYQI